MLDGFQIVAALFLVMTLGYALAAKGWIDAEVAAFYPRRSYTSACPRQR